MLFINDSSARIMCFDLVVNCYGLILRIKKHQIFHIFLCIQTAPFLQNISPNADATASRLPTISTASLKSVYGRANLDFFVIG